MMLGTQATSLWKLEETTSSMLGPDKSFSVFRWRFLGFSSEHSFISLMSCNLHHRMHASEGSDELCLCTSCGLFQRNPKDFAPGRLLFITNSSQLPLTLSSCLALEDIREIYRNALKKRCSICIHVHRVGFVNPGSL